MQSDISVTVSSTAAGHDMRILSAITGEGCKLVADAVKITVNPASALVQTGGQSGTTDNLCVGDVIGVGGDKDPIMFKFGGGATSMLLKTLMQHTHLLPQVLEQQLIWVEEIIE